MPRPSDYIAALRLLGAAFPTHPLDEATLEAYAGSLARKGVDHAVLTAAAVRWMETEDRYPSVAKLLDACGSEVRRRRDAARLEDEQAAYERGVLPGTAPATGAFAIEMVDVFRTALVGTVDVPAAERGEAVELMIGELLDERGFRVTGPVPTFECPLCRDTGMYVTCEEPFTVRPCRCNPAGFARWEAGHLRPNHDCVECADIRRGRST